MKITSKKHNLRNKKFIRASDEIDYSSDEKYLEEVAEKIESLLLTDFDIEASVWFDGSCIHIESASDDYENEALIEPNDMIGFIGDLEADAYPIAEEYYTSI